MAPTRVLAVLTLLATVAACATGAPVQEDGALVRIEGLGSLSFPNSGAPEAQGPFLRGVLLLHSFEFEPAAAAFREAQQIDPNFALAYWGEAMTYNHPLWRQQDRDAVAEALARLGATAQERAAKAPTGRERMYLEAVEALYSDAGSKATRDAAYMSAMQRLTESYPEDHEARAFYALSILGSRDGTRDFATYMRAAATVQPVFDANPDHPGAAHYLIHSFDDPVHALLGLPAALAYSEIAPNAAHAQHMTSHIFVATGMWEDVVTANTRARDAQDAKRVEGGSGPNVCGHYSSWLHYGHLMLGQVTEAESLMDACHGGVVEGKADTTYFALMRARQLLDTGDWDQAEKWQVDLPENGVDWTGSSPRFLYQFTNAFAALRAGDPAPATAFEAEHHDTEVQAEQVQVAELAGLLALHAGRQEEGVAMLRDAAETEDSMPFQFGPPLIVKPTFELLGEELLLLGRHEEAAAAFERATGRTPGRTPAVRGLAESRDSAP